MKIVEEQKYHVRICFEAMSGHQVAVNKRQTKKQNKKQNNPKTKQKKNNKEKTNKNKTKTKDRYFH